MLRLFISYGRSDSRELAIRLRDDLRRIGYSVWLDLSEIAGGASWSEDIERAIEHCDVALVLMSKASYDSQWCRAEQLRAIRKGKRIVPLRVQTDTEIPLHLEHLNYIDFTKIDQYDAMFRDLSSDLLAGQAFQSMQQSSARTDSQGASPFKAARSTTGGRSYKDEKRSAPAFRRHLAMLRREEWLGSRYWWPYFLFAFIDVQSAAQILTLGELHSPADQGENFNSRWDKFVRLYFRPRTPNLYRVEGFRSGVNGASDYCPMPVYLLFDMESILCQPESRFADGDPARTGKTYKTPAQFNELPFEQIYHDSWFMPDEREEIMRCRESQVIIPDRLGLEALQYIWTRSAAEYETLRSLLSPEIWRRWRDKITHRTDYNLFNRRWTYIEEALLTAQQAVFHFNRCDQDTDCASFMISIEIEGENDSHFEWSKADFVPTSDLSLTIPDTAHSGYQIRVHLDGDLAYQGQYRQENTVF